MSQDSRRIAKSKIRDPQWALNVAEEIIAHSDEDIYTTAAGISPSGVVHFGNFRDVMTAHMVREAFIEKGKKTRLIFSWDNFDRFRKVPVGVPESFSEHVGKPLSSVPDPLGELGSYAERYQQVFVEGMKALNIDIEYRDQTALYKSGVYDDAIILALQKREEIASVLFSYMSEKAIAAKNIDEAQYKKDFYPISVYSRFTDKDATTVLNYDGDSTITYLCKITGKEDTINIREDHFVKLNWKIDWPMRWKHEQVHFEPGGIDHASQGSSYDVGSVIAEKIFDYTPPVFVGYTFVGIQGLGSKMSGSKGNAISPLDLLEIYEPEILKWLYQRKAPNQSFELAFNAEIYRQYDEYDKETGLETISFRQLVGLGQIVQWQEDKFIEVAEQLELEYNLESVKKRIPLAKNWLEKYNSEEMVIFNTEVNTDYVQEMEDYRKEQIIQFQKEFKEMTNPTIAELELLSYKIPKDRGYAEDELKKQQRQFFADIYNLLIGKNRGPRLGTFLWASDPEFISRLLDI